MKTSTRFPGYWSQYHDSVGSKQPKLTEYYSFIPTLPNFLRYWFCNLNILKCVCMGVFCTIPYNWKKKKNGMSTIDHMFIPESLFSGMVAATFLSDAELFFILEGTHVKSS